MTWEEVNKTLSQRTKDQLKSRLTDKDEKILFLLSPNDVGVMRNGGRNGSCYGPKALMSQLLKLATRNKTISIKQVDVCTPTMEIEDFNSFQENQSALISKLINKQKKVVNLGGGHDHAYPFIDSLIKDEKVTVINIDAHLDTRNDNIAHSGTPFRQLKEKYKDQLNLIQIGIHQYANVYKNYDGIEMIVYHMDDIKKETKTFKDNHTFVEKLFKSIPNDHIVILSLDADAISAQEMQAVSAVNHDGLPMEFVREIFSSYNKLNQNSFIGIYEYNPLYDDLGCSGARAISSLLYESIK